jgi:hypothetical protein
MLLCWAYVAPPSFFCTSFFEATGFSGNCMKLSDLQEPGATTTKPLHSNSNCQNRNLVKENYQVLSLGLSFSSRTQSKGMTPHKVSSHQFRPTSSNITCARDEEKEQRRSCLLWDWHGLALCV